MTRARVHQITQVKNVVQGAILAYSYSRLIEKQNVVSADMERAHFKQKAFLHIQFNSIW